MKKHIILYAAAVLALASCSQQDGSADIGGDERLAIRFAPTRVGQTLPAGQESRATGELSSENIKTRAQLAVWGVRFPKTEAAEHDTPALYYESVLKGEAESEKWEDLFAATTLVWDGESGEWAYQGGRQYWLSPYSYQFAAMAPASAVSAVSRSGGRFTIAGIPAVQVAIQSDGTDNVESCTDYLVSDHVDTDAARSSGTGVQFNMHHILSRLDVYIEPIPELTVQVQIAELALDSRATHTYEQYDFLHPTCPGEDTEHTDTWTPSVPAGGGGSLADEAAPSTCDAVQEAGYTWYGLKPRDGQTADVTPFDEPLRLPARFLVAPGNGGGMFLHMKYRLRYHTPGDPTPDPFYGPRETEWIEKLVQVPHEFLQGHRHNLRVKVSERQIAFSVDAAEWDNDDPDPDTGDDPDDPAFAL